MTYGIIGTYGGRDGVGDSVGDGVGDGVGDSVGDGVGDGVMTVVPEEKAPLKDVTDGGSVIVFSRTLSLNASAPIVSSCELGANVTLTK